MKKLAITYQTAYDTARDTIVGTLLITSVDLNLRVDHDLPPSAEIDAATFALMLRQLADLVVPGSANRIAGALAEEAALTAAAVQVGTNP